MARRKAKRCSGCEGQGKTNRSRAVTFRLWRSLWLLPEMYSLSPTPSLITTMGRFSRRKHNAQPRKERTENTAYTEVVKENSQMEEYYKAQKIVSEEEWPTFWEHLKVTLPTTFRITGTRRYGAYDLSLKKATRLLLREMANPCIQSFITPLIQPCRRDS
jgi:hypothetical protein